MNKTIINGIDVSECKFYEEMRKLPDNLNGGYYIEHYYCGLQGDNYCICNKNPNCYFKQFKRLQEENEELKEENSHKSCLIWYIFNCSKVETIQRLLYEYYECINDDRYNKKRVKKFWDDVFHLRPRRKYKSKYKQALEEIREIVKEEQTDIKTVYTKRTYERLNKIKNKINEVLK